MQTDNQSPSLRQLIQTTGVPFTAVQFPRRSTIFFQGDEADSVLFIESGRVELAVVAPSGKEAICGLPGTGAFIGEEVLAGAFVRSCTATAMTPTEVLVVKTPEMLRLLATQPDIAARFVMHTVNRSTQLVSDLAGQVLYSSEKRLARVLLALAESPNNGGKTSHVLPDVTQEFMARMVGTTRSRVNMFLGKFKKHGMIQMRGGVLQINPTLLQGMSDDGFEPVGRA
jgi:CRP-like cAMP-binding protein